MLIKSRVKYIQSLSQKKVRNETGTFLIEGPKCLHEILAVDPGAIEAVYATEKWIADNPGIAGVTEVSADELEKVSHLSTPNQVLALVRKPPVPKGGFGEEISIFLETIQDPGNMGTILRLADWFGIRQVAATPDSVDFFHPKVVQSSMGSILRVQCLEMTGEELVRSSRHIPLWAATLDGTDMRTLEKPSGAVLLIGNESKGLSPGLLAQVNQRLTIPSLGKAESLNAAVATGILLAWLRL